MYSIIYKRQKEKQHQKYGKLFDLLLILFDKTSPTDQSELTSKTSVSKYQHTQLFSRFL